ncbi:protein ORF60 [Cyprinid herpesvirus 3]|nr:protein ORF60 [Cyprinid herpesvirus 3]
MFHAEYASLAVDLTVDHKADQLSEGDYVQFTGQFCLSDLLGPCVDDGSEKDVVFLHRLGRVKGELDKYPGQGYFTITGHRDQSVVAGTHDAPRDRIYQALGCGPWHEWLPGMPLAKQRETIVKSIHSYLGSKLQKEFRTFRSEYLELKQKGTIQCTWSGSEVSQVCYTKTQSGVGVVHFKNLSRAVYPNNVSDIASASSMFVKFLMSLRALHVAGASRTWIGYLSRITNSIDRGLLVDRNLVGQAFGGRFAGGALGPHFEGTETDTTGLRHYTHFFSSKAVDAVCEAFHTFEAVSNTFMADVLERLTLNVHIRRELIKLKTATEIRFQLDTLVESFTVSKKRCLADYPNLYLRHVEAVAKDISMDGVEVDENFSEDDPEGSPSKKDSGGGKASASSSVSKKSGSGSGGGDKGKAGDKGDKGADETEDPGKDGWSVQLDTLDSVPFRKACLYFSCAVARNTLESVILATATETFAKKHKQKINVYAPAQQAMGRGVPIDLLQRQLDILKEGQSQPQNSQQQLLAQLQKQLAQLQQQQQQW